MIDHKYNGFICNKTTFKDNDAIINVLTKDGKKTFKARGILKITSKNAANCNYFMISEFICQSKSELSNQSLKTATSIKIYKKPFEDLLVSSCYLFIANILDKVSDSINGYDIAIKCFDLLEEGTYPIIVVNYFLKNLCDGLGYMPNLSGCVYCNNKQNLISFDFESGGFICKNCFNQTMHNKIPSLFLKEIYNFLSTDTLYMTSEEHSINLFKMYYSFFKDSLNLFTNNFEFVLKCI